MACHSGPVPSHRAGGNDSDSSIVSNCADTSILAVVSPQSPQAFSALDVSTPYGPNAMELMDLLCPIRRRKRFLDFRSQMPIVQSQEPDAITSPGPKATEETVLECPFRVHRDEKSSIMLHSGPPP